MAGLITIDVSAEIKRITKALTNLAYKQVPFATATALTLLAKSVKETESENIARTFKKPRAFTKNSIGVKAARKNNLVATVFVKPIAARYMAPYEEGGNHVLPGTGRVLFNPKNIKLDANGQLPRTILARLKARSDIFIGPVKAKGGVINGVWQRLPLTKAQVTRRSRSANPLQPGHLKLIIRFGQALPVNKRLGYRLRAERMISARFRSAFSEAMGNAMDSAR